MIPIQLLDMPSSCRPEWVKLNHLLSYCTRPLISSDSASSAETAPRCNHHDCLFSATRL
jgi:hypothetical protein